MSANSRGSARPSWAALSAGVTLFGMSAALSCALVAPLGERRSASGEHVDASTADGAGTTVVDAALEAAPYAEADTSAAADAAEVSTTDNDAPPGGCNTSAECSLWGADEAYRCTPDRRCVSLKTSDCPIVLGAKLASDPDAILLGAFAGINMDRPEQSPEVVAYALAIDELNQDGGLYPGRSQRPRPLVMVVCNASADVEAAMRHLDEDLGVPAIVAHLDASKLISAYANHHPGHILYLNPGQANRALAEETLLTNGLGWHMLGMPSDVAPAYDALIVVAERYVRDVQRPGAATVQLALVTTKGGADQELANAVEAGLNLNGKSAQDNGADGYRRFTIDPPTATAPSVAREIIAWQPDLVISTASELFNPKMGVLQTIEEEWRTGGGDAGPRSLPFYVLSPVNDLGFVRSVIGADLLLEGPLAARRFLGINVAESADLTLQHAFQARVVNRSGGSGETQNFYDAAYFLAYAVAGADPNTVIDGPAVSRGMLRLLGDANSRTINVGPEMVRSALDALKDGTTTVRLVGTLGPPSLDPKTGIRTVVGGVFCFQILSGNTVTVLPAELRYENDKFVGKFDNCNPNIHQ